MNKNTIKGIVIVVGAIISFIFMRFINIDGQLGQYFSGWVLASSVIAITALLFGSIAGGAIGLFGALISDFSRGFSPEVIPWILLYSLLYGIYGFVLGKIFESNIRYVKENNIAKSLGIFAISSVLVALIVNIIIGITIYFRFLREYGIGFFRFFGQSVVNSLISSLIIGVIGLLLVLIYHKALKFNIPFFPDFDYVEKEKPVENRESLTINQTVSNNGSYFDGSFWHLVGLYIGGFLVCLITLGIAFPWVYCWFTSWRVDHTVVEGKRLKFNGKGISLLGHFILKGWLLGIILTPLTLGLYPMYYFNVSLRKWEVKNTNFSNN